MEWNMMMTLMQVMLRETYPPDLPENSLAIVSFSSYSDQKEQPNVVREQVIPTQTAPFEIYIDPFIFDNLPPITPTEIVPVTTFHEDLMWAIATQGLTTPKIPPSPATLLNLHDLFFSPEPVPPHTLPFVPISSPCPAPTFPVITFPALTYGSSSQEQAIPYSDRLSFAEERIGWLELQVSSLQEELEIMKKENEKMKEQLRFLPSLIGSQIQQALSNLWQP